MTPELTNQMTVGLLLLWLATVVAMGIVLSLVVIGCIKRRRVQEAASSETAEFKPEETISPLAFGYPGRWLAIRNTGLSTVQAALRLHNPVPCSWGEGLARLAEDKLFVSPPIQGWVLVIGNTLPSPSEDVDECFYFLAELSRTLGHVQFFYANRVLNHHGWARLERGNVLRAYAWIGETVWNQGPLTAAEKQTRVSCLDYGEVASLEYGKDDVTLLNTEKVSALAGRWSLDPTVVDDGMLSGLGVSGDIYLSERQ